MDKALRKINAAVDAGLITNYAIGGAMALLFHTEPVLTYDLDVYCFLPESQSRLISLEPIYAFFKKQGYKEDKEHIIIERLPVQFIAAYNDLVTEAVENAEIKKFKGVSTRVVMPEYLFAIMLQTDRPKDRARLPQTLQQAGIARRKLLGIIKRHGLTEKWQRFCQHNYE
jgi:hypothetical protein